MSIRNLQYLMVPGSVAVFGASEKPSSVGGLILRNIQSGGYTGPIFVVNPKYATVCGCRSFATAEELPIAPELAILAVPADQIGGVTAALAKRGTKAVVVITAGFAGDEAINIARRQDLLDAAKPHLLRIVGPNCFGVLAPTVGLNAYFGRSSVRSGTLALVAQSGAMISAILDWAAPRSIGFSHVVSLGDMLDVDFGDMLDVLAADPKTHTILLYVETITHARKFMSAARAAARLKPVIVVKAGRTVEGAKAASSHTGAIAGNDAVYDAAFARAGILRVANLQGLFDAAATLGAETKVRGDRLAIVTNGGGAGVMAADDLSAAGGVLAQLSPDTIARLTKVLPPIWSKGNPVDLIGDADGDRYAAALQILSLDPSVDAILAIHCPTGVTDPLTAATAVTASPAATRKPIFTCWLGEESVAEARHHLAAHGIATTDTPEAAVTGFMSIVRHQRLQRSLLEVPHRGADVAPHNVKAVANVLAQAVAAGQTWLSAPDVRRILDCYGIRTNRVSAAATPEAAAAAAEALGGKVAVKISSADIVHKSDVGGVVLGLSLPAEVAHAARDMMQRVTATHPNARIAGVTVEEMIDCAGSHELFLGMTVDPTFGPILAFGQGGTAVELTNDVALGLPPLNGPLATAMIDKTRVARLLRGYRQRPPANIDAVTDALLRLSQLIVDHPAIADVDINPLMANEHGVIAIDARMRLHAREGRSRLAICPYPSDLAHTFELGHRWRVHVRPIRPQDEDALRAMVASLEPAASGFRFFAPLRELDHETISRLTQIDYDREIVLAAFADERAERTLVGVAHLHADPDNTAAETAVVIRSDWHNRGLATVLLRELIAVARGRGIGRIWGKVLCDNERMLNLARELGFQAVHSADPTTVRMELALAPAAALTP